MPLQLTPGADVSVHVPPLLVETEIPWPLTAAAYFIPSADGATDEAEPLVTVQCSPELVET